MELRQLTTFRMIAQTASFSRTASALSYAQSTVSAQIQALEEELGVSLFDRLGKTVVLTEAGQTLLGYAEKILNLVDEAQLAVSSGEELSGSLTISAAETLCAYRLPAVIREFRARYPQVEVTLRMNHGDALEQELREGMLDVAFIMAEPFQATNLLVRPLIPEPLLVLAPPNHPLATQPTVTFSDLQNESLILTENTCLYRRMFLRALRTAGVQPTTIMEFHSVEAIKQSVMVGLGLALLPLEAVKNEIAQGKLVPLNWAGRDFAVVTQM
ncbi:MAG: LysR family transcriptional regulator, partial [Anaerolineae bacterium]|nr:LysR family transcriptional regulator [Anaerolineae bacterium]